MTLGCIRTPIDYERKGLRMTRHLGYPLILLLAAFCVMALFAEAQEEISLDDILLDEVTIEEGAESTAPAAAEAAQPVVEPAAAPVVPPVEEVTIPVEEVTIPTEEVTIPIEEVAVPAVEPAVEVPAVVPVIEQPVDPPVVEDSVIDLDADLDVFGDEPAAGTTPPAQPAPAVSPVVAVEPDGTGVTGAAPQPALTAAEDRALSEVSTLEKLRRRALDDHGRQSLQQGLQLLQRKKYKEAINHLDEATEYISARPETMDEIALAREKLGEAYYLWAQELVRRRDLETARQQARLAIGRGEMRALKVLEQIKTLEDDPVKGEPKVERPKPRWRQDDYRTSRKVIADHLRDARQYIESGELDRATSSCEIVLDIDAFNTEAIRLKHKIVRRRYEIATEEVDATQQEMVMEVRDAWNPRDYEYASGRAHSTTIMTETKEDRWKTERDRIIKKMEEIIIPEIEFRQANINAVIEFLQEASEDYDTTSKDDERKGVNIILNLRKAGDGGARAVGRAERVDPFAVVGSAAPAEGAASGGVPPVTFSARRVSLFEALRIVCEVANLKYRIKGSAVMVVPSDAPVDEIIHRMYNVLPSVGEKIAATREDIGGGRARGGSDFMPLETTRQSTEREDWKEFFGEMGVPWPQGSSIKHLPTIGKIVVANTPDSLAIFERILEVLNVVPSQIEIETRFVEVMQEDLDSLGFEWGLSDDYEVAQRAGQAAVPLASRERIKVNAGPLTRGNRFLTEGFGLGGVAVADDVLTIASVLTNPEVYLVLHLLSQKGNTDLLSAPKVTTQSGSEATMKVVTEYIYPTEFTVSGIAGATDGATTAGLVGAVVEPSGFETREVGVVLSVVPEVSPEGQMINLTMTPEVVTEPVWKNYGSTYTDEAGNVQQLNMEQPFFFTRSVSTSISIYNGATVVMGGMITEARTQVDDRIPILGDIPLIGRLFRSQYEQSDKRNLLIFVTARLVDPAGQRVKRQEGLSMPEAVVGGGI